MHETILGEHHRMAAVLRAALWIPLTSSPPIRPWISSAAKVPVSNTMSDVKTLFREKGIYSVGALFPSVKGEPLREGQTIKEIREQVVEDDSGNLVLYTRV